MFSKKYIFETKGTKLKRYFKNFLFLGLALFAAYIGMCFYLIIHSKELHKQASNTFYKRPPDLIVVFTGHHGRIPFAIKKAKEFNQSHIFITGVYSKNTIPNLVPTDDDNLNPDLLEIDYLARNTVENVLSTYRYLNEQKAMRNILIISHDYHLTRSKMIIDQLGPKSVSEDYNFYYMGVESSLQELRSYKIIFIEVFKLIRARAFLALWDYELPPLQ